MKSPHPVIPSVTWAFSLPLDMKVLGLSFRAKRGICLCSSRKADSSSLRSLGMTGFGYCARLLETSSWPLPFTLSEPRPATGSVRCFVDLEGGGHLKGSGIESSRPLCRGFLGQPRQRLSRNAQFLQPTGQACCLPHASQAPGEIVASQSAVRLASRRLI